MNAIPIVDAHHHIWRQADLPWLLGPMQPRIFGPYEPIRRDYPIGEYLDDIAGTGVTRSVYVQANWAPERFEDEVAWVQRVADEHGWPHGIVGCVDLLAGDVRPQLDRIARYPLLRGVRMQLHWHENEMYRFAAHPDLALDPVVQRNVARLADYGLVFDLQVFAGQMAGAAELADACPDVTFVLQHAGMLEDLSVEGRAEWRAGMERLAERPNVCSKLSAFGTFIHRNDAAHIAGVLRETVEIFGAERCLFGSNFPIEKLWTSYWALLDAFLDGAAGLDDSARAAIFAETAARVYRLAPAIAAARTCDENREGSRISGAAFGAGSSEMTHDVRRQDFTSLVDPDAPVRRIGSGFEFTEGPIWHPTEHYLLFSDMPGDVRRRWDETGGVREVMRPSNKCNGMTYDAGLNLVICEHATSSLVLLTPDGRREVLASHFEGKELNSPNDVCVRSDGSIYFTDPWFGRMPVYGVERPRELGWQGVFRVAPDGGLHLVVDRRQFDQPNGLCFSPDESRLYVNDTTRALIRVFDVAPDGSLSHGRLFAQGIRSSREAGVPDGMKCDAKGNVWVTGPGGIRVYSPRGVELGTVRIPEMPANLHWGGEDWRTLFVCATTSVYAVETKVGANAEPFMRASGAASGGGTVRGPRAESTVQRAAPAAGASASVTLATGLDLDPSRCALIVQDMQNDVLSEGGAFAETGSPRHAREQNVVENIRRLADACRARGVMVVHVHFIVERGSPGLTLNAPLFEGLADANALVRGTWGAAPVESLEPAPGDHVVTKMRMSAWEGSSLETVLKSGGRDILIDTGAWTNMSIEHTARTGADKGYFMIVPEDACSTMNADWHAASVGYAMQNVAIVTRTDDVIAALGGAAPTAAAAAGTAPAGAGSAEAANEAIRRRMRERRERAGGD